MSRMKIVAPVALLSVVALVACTPGPSLPEPGELNPTLTQADGFSGGAGGPVDPDADPPAHISIQLDAGTYLLQVACTSVDGSEVTVTVDVGGGAAPAAHVAACGTVDESGFVAITTESEPFDAPGGDVTITATSTAAASFNSALVAQG